MRTDFSSPSGSLIYRVPASLPESRIRNEDSGGDSSPEIHPILCTSIAHSPHSVLNCLPNPQCQVKAVPGAKHLLAQRSCSGNACTCFDRSSAASFCRAADYCRGKVAKGACQPPAGALSRQQHSLQPPRIATPLTSHNPEMLPSARNHKCCMQPAKASALYHVTAHGITWKDDRAAASMAPACCGQGAVMSAGPSCGSACHSRSVTKGTSGCSSASMALKLYTSTCVGMTLFQLQSAGL